MKLKRTNLITSLSPPAGQRDAVLWKKTHGAGSVQPRPGVASLLANHI